MLQSLRSFRRPILALAVVCALAFLLAFALPGASQAATRTGHDFTYYNNASHTTVVGYRYYCINNSGGWGQITPYYVVNNLPCN